MGFFSPVWFPVLQQITSVNQILFRILIQAHTLSYWSYFSLLLSVLQTETWNNKLGDHGNFNNVSMNIISNSRLKLIFLLKAFGRRQTETIRGQRGLKLGVGSCNKLEVISGGRKTEVGSPSTAFGLANHKAEKHVIYNDPTFQTCKYQMGKTIQNQQRK